MLAPGGTIGMSSREPPTPPSLSEVVMRWDVGQSIGHCALFTAKRIRWPGANTHDVKCISISSGNNSPGFSACGSRAEPR